MKPPLSEEVVEYGSSYWTLSGKRLPYMRDKTRDSRFFVLTLFAIGRELERRGSLLPFEQIDLAVGLPPEHYGMLRDKFAQYFRRGVVKFTYKEQAHPPGHPAGAGLSPGLRRGDSPERAAAEDAPGVYRGHRAALPPTCCSFGAANRTCSSAAAWRAASSPWITRSSEKSTPSTIGWWMTSSSAMCCWDGRPSFPMRSSRTIQEAAKTHAKDILDQLRELGVDLRSNPAIFIGGGSSPVPALAGRVPHGGQGRLCGGPQGKRQRV